LFCFVLFCSVPFHSVCFALLRQKMEKSSVFLFLFCIISAIADQLDGICSTVLSSDAQVQWSLRSTPPGTEPRDLWLTGKGKNYAWNNGCHFTDDVRRKTRTVHIGCEVGSGITQVEDGMFKDFVGLEEIYFGDQVAIIGDNSFQGCTSLKKVVIPRSVNTTGDMAFAFCSNLEVVEIDEKVTYISPSAFYHCHKNFVKVKPGNSVFIARAGQLLDRNKGVLLSVPVMGAIAAGGKFVVDKLLAPKVKKINNNIADCRGQYSSNGFKSQLFDTGDFGFKEVVVPPNCSDIGAAAFAGNILLETVQMEDSVEIIEDQAFFGCEKLSSINLSSKLEVIGAEAFRDCSSLENIILPASLKLIGEGAFKECSTLKSISIPSMVNEVGLGAFSRCSNLERIEVSLENPYYSSLDNVLFNKNASLLIQLPASRRGKYLLPDSVESIQSSALKGCNRLTEFEVSDNNSNFNVIQGVLFDKNNSTLLKYPEGKTANSYVVPDSVLYISDNAFRENVLLKSVTIGESVNFIGYRAFASCSGLKTVKFNGTVEPAYCDSTSFEGCTKLKTVTVPSWYMNETFCGIEVSRSTDFSSELPSSAVKLKSKVLVLAAFLFISSI